ncbi:MAG: RDD family protein [Lewinellaceae bacterium]|nr:RDD family protein [Lewinellaceae bacterium]
MKSIEITTTQNVTIEYELARLRERGLAWFMDLMLLLLGYFILMQLARALFGGIFSGDISDMVWVLLPFLGYFLYNIFFEIWNIGQTPGKMAMSIKVVRLDGKDPEWSDVVLRAVLHLVDSLFSFSVIGAVLIKTTGKSQRLGDLAANTTVIRIKSTQYQFRLDDILGISTLSNYQPTYPQVRDLGERDMIFIKNVLVRLQRYPNQAHQEVVEDLVTHLMPLLRMEQRPPNRVEFLRTLLRDYIVLTR